MVLSISDQEFNQKLTLRQAFEVLRAFLDQFNSRGAQETDLLASWQELQPDGGTADLRSWTTSWRALVQFRRAAPNSSFKPKPLRGLA
jgi:hypothetical protein